MFASIASIPQKNIIGAFASMVVASIFAFGVLSPDEASAQSSSDPPPHMPDSSNMQVVNERSYSTADTSTAEAFASASASYLVGSGVSNRLHGSLAAGLSAAFTQNLEDRTAYVDVTISAVDGQFGCQPQRYYEQDFEIYTDSDRNNLESSGTQYAWHAIDGESPC
ncbi:hypothetical protein EPH95_07610 [Salicibibacter halophilus]|uniref:Uncharacterized protein n=1 Tax=Salicibibacter halophilus TaxID=2502791 RepID=A0A514LGT9_9BACI|nr:hypothetical protein [Salicibibacter halophilus]QDI91067.1 hypothetical protein EPH95_07610 [Salicibibacter halophilus]